MLTCQAAVIWCVFAGAAYVASLYVWWSDRGRNPDTDPLVARHRMLSALLSTAVLLLLLCALTARYGLAAGGLLSFIGADLDKTTLKACVAAAALVLVLYLGPLSLILSEGHILVPKTPGGPRLPCYVVRYFSLNFIKVLPRLLGEAVVTTDFWRCIVVGPVTEELVYRACMCPVLRAAGCSRLVCCVVPPLCFGMAHVHHFAKNARRDGVAEAAYTALLQIAYTTLFGMFSSFVFLRTGQVAAPIVAHALCNSLGLPDFTLLFERTHRRGFFTALYLLGVVLFVALLCPLTNPASYHTAMW